MQTDLPAVVIAHEDAIIDAGLRHILSKRDEFRIDLPAGATHSGGTDFVADVLVLDHAAGIAWVTRHRSEVGRTKVMVVSPRGQDADVRSALEAGVRGYVVTGCPEEEVVDATRAVAAGRRHLCAAATLQMVDSLSQPTLTVREHDVLALVCRGLNNKEVARSLDISVGTVKSHMRGILSKLDAKCRTEALYIATRRGLVKRSSPALTDVPHAFGSTATRRATSRMPMLRESRAS